MKDELTRQCEMAWKRGNTLGRWQGAGLFLLGTILYEIIKAVFKFF